EHCLFAEFFVLSRICNGGWDSASSILQKQGGSSIPRRRNEINGRPGYGMLSIFRTPEAAKSLRDLPRRCPSSLPVRMISHLIIAAHQLRGCGPGRTDF